MLYKIGGNFLSLALVLMIGGSLFISCQKEIDGSISGSNGGGTNPTSQKPKVGTQWIYLYSTYYSNGSLRENYLVTYKADSEETFGGEKWLKIINMTTGDTVYFLHEKTGSLYQYTNNSSNLLCKYPAVPTETYTTYNAGGTEDFTVIDTSIAIVTGINNLKVNYYQGVKNSLIIDKIWYNDHVWIAQQYLYVKFSPISPYYRISALVLQQIVY